MRIGSIIKSKYFWVIVRFLNKHLPKTTKRKYVKNQKFKVLNKNKTLEMLQNKKCSFARFGDGEISILIGEKGPAFQNSNPELRENSGMFLVIARF